MCKSSLPNGRSLWSPGNRCSLGRLCVRTRTNFLVRRTSDFRSAGRRRRPADVSPHVRTSKRSDRAGIYPLASLKRSCALYYMSVACASHPSSPHNIEIGGRCRVHSTSDRHNIESAKPLLDAEELMPAKRFSSCALYNMAVAVLTHPMEDEGSKAQATGRKRQTCGRYFAGLALLKVACASHPVSGAPYRSLVASDARTNVLVLRSLTVACASHPTSRQGAEGLMPARSLLLDVRNLRCLLRNKILIMQKLFNTNAHLGYRTATSNFQPYLYGFRNKIAIIDLDKTLFSLRRVCSIIQKIIGSKGHLLFVNTNPDYNSIVRQTALKTGQSFLNHKWIGGLLTNWNHMQNVHRHFKLFSNEHSQQANNDKQLNVETKAKSKVRDNTQPTIGLRTGVPVSVLLPRNKELLKNKKEGPTPSLTQGRPIAGPSEAQGTSESADGGFDQSTCTMQSVGLASRGQAVPYHIPSSAEALPKVNELRSFPRFQKMQKCFEGIVTLERPDCIIVLNANQNQKAIEEANRLQIPIICLVDSNVSNNLQNKITYPIPANADSFQFIYILCNSIFKTIVYSQIKSNNHKKNSFGSTKGAKHERPI